LAQGITQLMPMFDLYPLRADPRFEPMAASLVIKCGPPRPCDGWLSILPSGTAIAQRRAIFHLAV
jgi:hypothetical protein